MREDIAWRTRIPIMLPLTDSNQSPPSEYNRLGGWLIVLAIWLALAVLVSWIGLAMELYSYSQLGAFYSLARFVKVFVGCAVLRLHCSSCFAAAETSRVSCYSMRSST